MKRSIEVTFADSSEPKGGLAIVAATAGGTIAKSAAGLDPKGVIGRANDLAGFSGKAKATNDIIAPEGARVDRIVVLGLGDAGALKPHDWLTAGGIATAQLKKAELAAVFLDVPGLDVGAREAADFASACFSPPTASTPTRRRSPRTTPTRPRRRRRSPIVVADPPPPRRPSPSSVPWPTA